MDFVVWPALNVDALPFIRSAMVLCLEGVEDVA